MENINYKTKNGWVVKYLFERLTKESFLTNKFKQNKNL